ncbi:biotin transporter BioY [Devosia sp. J2-20]|jgi:biotin transport system substrate-specific component|uniref:Biotin transporter n=1 Tax=Devosia litorisediminis TaxID=2829817 RepID=A0A942IEF0_9HYPH|nr:MULTISPECIES: biotin transporter BioY [Devosia]MBS3849280.1 biotin transporter BioY [Devosia litorisediminis]MCZ4344718.1 biotin transporter BioY [Devosia neptuniae]WDQ97664.1 biotin transporter BioY [Devosia sp. J2-20]|tara:strand:+ start:1451 stop:2062 length:612 start_codon:yes stop_codon:yes gene_type:complete
MAVTLTTPNTLLGLYQPKGDAAKLASNLATVVLGTLLITLCAKINVPVWPVPVTLQGFAIAALAAAFGMRIGVATVGLYLLEGAMGLPVFATGGGLAYLVGPTGGFLLGFVALAAIVGFAADRGASGKPLALFSAMLVGDAVMFVLGFAWLVIMAGQAGWIDQTNVIASAFAKAVQPFVIWDILKMALAALTVTGAWKMVAKR